MKTIRPHTLLTTTIAIVDSTNTIFCWISRMGLVHTYAVHRANGNKKERMTHHIYV